MKVLYVSFRINAPDGSSVHGRAFAHSVRNLGHQIATYPPMRDIDISFAKPARKKTLWHYLSKLNFRTLKYYLGRMHWRISELIDFVDGLKGSISHFRDLKKLVVSYAPDVIVCRQEVFHFAPIWVARASGTPCVLEVNSIRSIESSMFDPNGKASFLTRWAERWPLRRADCVFSVSNAIKTYVDKYVDPDRSHVVPNGVDTDQFNPQRFDRDTVRQQLGVTGKTVLGYVGSYKIWHGLPVALDVVELLMRTSQDYHLLLIGDGHAFKVIAAEVSRRGMSSCVTQVPYLPHDEVARYMAAFDYALMTYPEMEGFYFSPLKMYEYLAMGIPVIATRLGQVAEVLQHKCTGMLVYPPTPDAFAAAIQEADRDPGSRDAMRRACRDLTVREYSWTANAQQVLALCEGLLESGMRARVGGPSRPVDPGA